MPLPVDARREAKSGPGLPEIDVSSQPTQPVADNDRALPRSQTDHEAVETRLQDEIHVYIERIDALQSKLKYLAKEAADSARKAAASAQPGSLEKKLLEKEEQIAALMEEGQRLSKTELDHRATIKKLRQYIADSTKSLSDANRRTEMAQKNLAKAEESAKRAELAERRAIAKLNTQSRNERQLEVVKAERDGFSAAIQDLKSQLASALSRADAAERRIKAESTENESRQVTELKDDLASARLERELSEGKLRKEIAELKDGVQRERERARLLELELRGEQSALENKMETLRAKAEEVSSGATGDAQAKLLRQIEVLQSQYAVATENWHGIESSLLSRLAGVEKERDEVAQKEDKARRKVREVVSDATVMPAHGEIFGGLSH
jgi:predicted  nucleic acid-binding Zn-ribbon protein